jgi:cell division protease FtsH
MGAERRSMMLTDQEKRTTAIHEAGHTLVGRSLPGTDPIHKVTIIPRGMALGVTQTLPREDRVSMDKVKAENMISFLMGGRVAEEVLLDQKTTGAGNDIERATDIARRMVTEWGMSDVLGPLTFGQKQGDPVFLGRDISQHRDYSENTAQTIDQEVRAIVEKNYKRAKQIVQENVAALHRLTDALLQYETIDGEEVDKLIRGETLTRAKPEIRNPKPEGGGAATPVMA